MITFCSRPLISAKWRSSAAPLKVQHTVRAALSLMYEKLENSEKALSLAGHLPHTRESREEIVMILKSHPSREAIDSYMRDLVLGE